MKAVLDRTGGIGLVPLLFVALAGVLSSPAVSSAADRVVLCEEFTTLG